MAEQIDALIRRVKDLGELGQIRFIREYRSEKAETPISGFLAVVGVKSAEEAERFLGGYVSEGIKGVCRRIKAEIRLCSPRSENGEGLSEVASTLLSSLHEADEEGLITEAAAGEIEFDSLHGSIFRRLSLTLEYCVCGEEEDV